MFDYFSRLLRADFMPHGQCMRWEPETLWLHVVADCLIGTSYYMIPFALLYFVRRRTDLAFQPIFVMFAAFILACGTTHFIDVWTLWEPVYRLEGVVKALTGVVSLATAIALFPLMPRALALPSPSAMREANEQLEAALGRLELEVHEREQAQQETAALAAQLEERVGLRTVELQRSNERLQEFIYAVSHDLREPLRTVAGFARLLLRNHRESLDEEARGHLDQMSSSVHRMAEQLDGLLQLSRMGEETQPREVDVGRLLQEVEAGLEQLIEDAGARVESGEMPTVHGDPVQVGLVLQNLITNAVKFRREGVAPVVRVGAERERDWWHLSVADNGIGIPEHAHERIFRPFQRLHAEGEFPGSGIGLALCARAVERHGGRMWVESTPGEGSTFHFTLPAAPGGA